MTLQQKRDLLGTLQNTKAWLDNLERMVGGIAFMDAAPNNWGGRLDIGKSIYVLRVEVNRHEQRSSLESLDRG